MSNQSEKEIWEQIREIASAYPYPDTPELASAVILQIRERRAKKRQPRKRWAWVAVTTLFILAITAFFVPQMRAQILEFLQIGSIRIFTTQPTSTLQSSSIEPNPTMQTFPSLDNLAGETTLEQAQTEISFLIPLPTYPVELGSPDRVFVQDFEGQAVLLIWVNPENPDQIILDLMILGPGTFAQKSTPEMIVHTVVNDQPALWTQGQHYLQIKGNDYQSISLVAEGNILIWEQDRITYRLESDLSLEEAIKVAESLE